jgi:16S rRNA C967 or C1407 C5-methylase (RsmB/RsmF family)/NOL1/NOP2/fmu family ribosome biogenesis protein
MTLSMKALPDSLMNSLTDAKGFDREAFERVHQSGKQVTSIRINPLKTVSQFPNFLRSEVEGSLFPISWSDYGYYLPERPSFTFDPLFHAGCYYVQEASSMFLEQALKQTTDISKPLRVLDLSAAPGGKSTHLQSLISADSLLVSNDVIRSRANVLKDNIIKWGCKNVVVTNNDPKDFSKLEGYFDVLVIDAPCSGSGLFRRDPEAIDEWSLNNVQLCSQRQQRILADAWPCLKKDGILIYSTCSYSKEEDENIIEWLRQEFPVTSLPLTVPQAWGIVESGGGYRFWPDKVEGEGFFIACFQKQEGGSSSFRLKNKPAATTGAENELLGKWVRKEGLHFIKHENTVYAWPQQHAADFALLLEKLRVIYSGVLTGELVRDKLVPEHALALSGLVAPGIPVVPLALEQAIAYLQRRDIAIETLTKGWQLVSYEGQILGWINVLPNRVNNYYPREMRILKDH